MARPRVFFDITANDKPLGRVIIELRDDVVPRTAENFRQLCTGEKGFSYKGSHFYKILQEFSCEGGDVTNNNGSGGKSIYGKTFDDENFTLKHITGSVGMVSRGRNTNNSKFFILGGKASWLDGKQVVFGQVWEDGMDVVRKMAGYGSDSGKPKAKIVIADCGQL